MNMTGAGGVMVHFSVAWLHPNGDQARSIGFQLVKTSGEIVASGEIPSITAGSSVSAKVHAMGFADGEKLTLQIDPQNRIAEDGEQNNSVEVTVFRAPLPSLTDGVDLSFNDCHYHQMYYYRDPMFHFFVFNPNRNNKSADNVRYTIYDNDVQVYTAVIPHVLAPTQEQIASGEYPYQEIFLTDAEVYGKNPSRRPSPGRHEFTVNLDPFNEIEEKNEGNNHFRMIVEVPDDRVMPQQPGDKIDVRLQDPHFHQYPDQGRVRFHFFLSNFQNSNQDRLIKWRLTREDGLIIREDSAMVSALAFHEVAFDHFDDTDTEVTYRLTYDPDREIDEEDETNNMVQFIIDWSPLAWG